MALRTSVSLRPIFFTEKMHLISTDSPYNTRSVRGRSRSAHEVFSKKDMEDAMRLTSNFMASGEHVHIFCSSLMFHHWKRSLRAAKEWVEDVEGDLEGGKEKMPEVFEMEDQGILCIKRHGV